jgi:hypothetical protein
LSPGSTRDPDSSASCNSDVLQRGAHAAAEFLSSWVDVDVDDVVVVHANFIILSRTHSKEVAKEFDAAADDNDEGDESPIVEHEEAGNSAKLRHEGNCDESEELQSRMV